jgi:type II secretory pathway pseudopilin PulG
VARRGDAGFSMIEALIAAAILLIIALGLLPLFTRAINDNVSGNDATQATNAGRTQIEEMMNLPMDNQRLTVSAGGGGVAGGTLETKDYWTAGALDQTGDADEGWWTDAAGHGPVLWNRTTTVSDYNLAKLDSTGFNKDTVLLKQIDVVVENPKKNLFGNGQGNTLHIVKYD